MCSTICGDGIIAGTEMCDDGKHCDQDGLQCGDINDCAA